MPQLDNISTALRDTVRKMPSIIATEAVNFSKERFVAGNWIDNTTEPWKRRKTKSKWGKKAENTGRAILVKTGKLKRSIRKIMVSDSTIIIGTDDPKARAHNDGFRGEVKQHVKSYSRAKTKRGITKRKELKRSTKIEWGRVKTGETTVEAFDRTIRQNIPRRRFIGKSAALIQRLERVGTAELNRCIKSFLK
jgi:phage gpG-like protein